MATIQQSDSTELAKFQAWPWQVYPWRDTSPVMLLGGSAGGGKSRLAAEKIHGFLLHYPNATAVISRKAEDDMEISTIPLMLETIIDIENEPRCSFSSRANRVRYQNGSELIFKGIWDERAREGLRSIGKQGDVDIWWMEEAVEFEEEDFHAVIARMRGTAAGWTQIILSTNPGPKLHWINRRMIKGEEATFFPSDASMNPKNPQSYFDFLAMLHGVDGMRLRDGIWTDGVGLVVDTWLDDYANTKSESEIHGNVTKRADYIPDYGPVFWYCDDGYAGEQDEKTGWFTARSNPRVFLIGQMRKDGVIAIFGNHYEVQVLTDPHIARVDKMSVQHGWPQPKYTIYDGASPSMGGHLMKARKRPKGIRVKIDDGLTELRQWVGEDKNGVRRVLVHPRCSMLRFELGSYSYDKFGKPIDAHNHGIDALRYGTWHEAYGGPGEVEVVYAAGGPDPVRIDVAAIDDKINKVMMDLERKYANAPT